MTSPLWTPGRIEVALDNLNAPSNFIPTHLQERVDPTAILHDSNHHGQEYPRSCKHSTEEGAAQASCPGEIRAVTVTTGQDGAALTAHSKTTEASCSQGGERQRDTQKGKGGR